MIGIHYRVGIRTITLYYYYFVLRALSNAVQLFQSVITFDKRLKISVTFVKNGPIAPIAFLQISAKLDFQLRKNQ